MMRNGSTILLLLLSVCTATWGRARRQTACEHGQVACGPGAIRPCIPEDWLCDGDNDCGDYSDENSTLCESRYCPHGYTKCQGATAIRHCIRSTWLCDGDNDCGNNWDESLETCANRTCSIGRRKCPNSNRCISLNFFCDGDNDCGDHSDENVTLCAQLQCMSDRRRCLGNGKCIPGSYFCDGDNDCGDYSDESSCTNTCLTGRRRCPNSTRCIPESYFCDGDNDCGDYSDESREICGEECPSGYGLCGISASRRCIPLRWFCDGDNDCGDGSDEDSQYCASLECSSGYRKCPHTGRCINEDYFCDGDDDCGDMSDENPEECPQSCRPGYIRCPSGRLRCIRKQWLCDGDNDCGDNSDENQQFCESINPEGPEPSLITDCMNTIHSWCLAPITSEYMGMDPEAVIEKIANTDLRETCEPVLEGQECVTNVLSSCNLDQQMLSHIQQTIMLINTTVIFVCRENVEVFDQHKECLLRLGERGPVILDAISQQCGLEAPSRNSGCPPPGALDCNVNVISEQCGEEIASTLHRLGMQLLSQLNCTPRKRSKVIKGRKMMKNAQFWHPKIKQKAFRSLF